MLITDCRNRSPWIRDLWAVETPAVHCHDARKRVLWLCLNNNLIALPSRQKQHPTFTIQSHFKGVFVSCSFFLRRAKGRSFFFFHGRLFLRWSYLLRFLLWLWSLPWDWDGRTERNKDIWRAGLGLRFSSFIKSRWSLVVLTERIQNTKSQLLYSSLFFLFSYLIQQIRFSLYYCMLVVLLTLFVLVNSGWDFGMDKGCFGLAKIWKMHESALRTHQKCTRSSY
jgi:hypothetical protein